MSDRIRKLRNSVVSLRADCDRTESELAHDPQVRRVAGMCLASAYARAEVLLSTDQAATVAELIKLYRCRRRIVRAERTLIAAGGYEEDAS